MTSGADTRSILCFGSNVADASVLIDKAIALVAVDFEILARSTAYVTPSHNGVGADYTNRVVAIRTDLSVADIHARLTAIETALGRTPLSRPTGVMPMDIDLVIYRGDVIRPDDYARQHFTIGYRQLMP